MNYLLDAGLVTDLTAFGLQIVQFLADIIYSIAKFGIDFLTNPLVAGLVVAIVIVYALWNRRQGKRFI